MTNYEVVTNEELLDMVKHLIDTDVALSIVRGLRLNYKIIKVTKINNKTGVVTPAFDGLPYRVKLNKIKDRIIKYLDFEIYIDESYVTGLRTEEELIALFWGALHQIDAVTDKNGDVVVEEDGRPKLKIIKPDMIYEGYSATAEKFKNLSPEYKQHRQLINYNVEAFSE